MRHRLTYIILLLFLALINLAFSAKQKKPNILFLFADDHCYQTMHCRGNDEIKTPNLDKLSKSGTSFTHAYNMGAWHGAVCVASRGMLNTGQFLWKVQASENTWREEKKSPVKLWPEYMKEMGYETYFAGKWHTIGNPTKMFDHSGTLRGGMAKDHPKGYNRPHQNTPDAWSPSDPQFGGYWEGGRHWSEVLADESIGFIQDATEREKPFFMYLAFNAPHDPRQSPQEYVDMYPPETLSVPDSYVPENPYKEGMDSGEKLRDERLAPFPRTRYAIRKNRSEYYALVTHLDAQIGRIIEALQESGMADNTIIIYSADHGLALGAHGLLGKQNMYEHSLRAPLIFVGSGIKANKQIDTRVYIQDLMATTFDLAGGEKPEAIEFSTLMPLIKGKQRKNSGIIYGAFRAESQRMIIKDNMKLILYPLIGEMLLFDLNEDPQELHNLSKYPKYKKIIQQLFEELKKEQARMDDSLALDDFYPELR